MQTIRVTLVLLLISFLSSCGHMGYEVKRQKVVHAIWDGGGRVERPLEGADAKTFTVIEPYHYAKDKHAVYHYQTVIKGATPSSFTLLDDWYAVDNERVFYNGAVLPDRDAETFEVMSGYWTRDESDVYFLNNHRLKPVGCGHGDVFIAIGQLAPILQTVSGEFALPANFPVRRRYQSIDAARSVRTCCLYDTGNTVVDLLIALIRFG